ncbi:MAG: hypothetical protein IKX74_03680 [Erysipelotrichaceae bacterium]|nr:hypothetical protein [Erysipelotrichaceae bacterium]MBO4537825.1 hypothetical protein [Erysipelotrichaceae bacterium]MBR5048725.1 hypothetical protein [Erysipelotrichaceae bacterium]
MLFGKKKERKTYDHAAVRPVIRCSICTGEKVAGFQNIQTRSFQEVMLIRNDADLREFRALYGIEDELPTIY